jgi:hypothetical protein
MVYAVEKPTNSLTANVLDAIVGVLADPESPFEVIPVDAAIAEHVRSVPREPNADPGDRLIVRRRRSAHRSSPPTARFRP